MDKQTVGEVNSESVVRSDLRRMRVPVAGLLTFCALISTHVASAAAGTASDPANSINNFLTTITTIVRMATPFVALLAFAGLGLMYMGASIPMIADWKKDNPKAANSVVLGLIFILVATAASNMVTGAGILGQ